MPEAVPASRRVRNLIVCGHVNMVSQFPVVDFRKCLTFIPYFTSPWSKMWLRGKSICSWCNGSLDPSFMVGSLSYFLFQPVLHDWCNKGCSM